MHSQSWNIPKASGPHPRAVRPEPRQWTVWGEPLRMTLIANAGVLVEYRGEKLLIDGLHDGGDHPFSPVPPKLLEDVYAGRDPFSGLRLLAFTHTHSDHFSPGALQRFLVQNPVERILLPAFGAGEGPEAAPLRDALLREGIPLQLWDAPPGCPLRVSLPEGMHLTALRTPHMGGDPIPHYALLLEAGGKTVLFLGDAEADPTLLDPFPQLPTPQTVVVNPLILNRAGGRALIAQLAAERIVITHLPFHEQDDIRFRDLTVRELTRRGDVLPPATVLWDALDSTEL